MEMNLKEISDLKKNRKNLAKQIHDLENSNGQLAHSLDFYKEKCSRILFGL